MWLIAMAGATFHAPLAARLYRDPARPAMACVSGNVNPLAATAAAIDAMWTLPSTQEGHRRALAARETKESTHAIAWGKAEWVRHSSPDRYVSLLLNWPGSKLAQALVRTTVPLAAWAWIAWHLQLKFTTTAIGYAATPLGLLLAFRVNSVVARLHEARGLWGAMTYTARNLASTLAACELDEVTPAMRARCCRLLVAHAWCAKTAARFQQAEDVAPLLQALLPADDARAVAAARKPSLAVLSLLRRSTQQLPLKPHVARSVHEAIGELNRIFGGMERLLSTPLAPTYMRHTQRGLLLWLLLLPCGLLSAGCASAGKLVLVVSVVAYIMLGIDEIGIQIEQPFEVLPLFTLAAGLTRDVCDELLHETEDPAPAGSPSAPGSSV